jgi:hypothetical protein
MSQPRFDDHRDRLLRPSLQQWQGRPFESRHASPLPDGARRTAERLALSYLGIVAFSVTADPETGDYDGRPTVFFRAGQLTSEFDARL